MGFQKYFQQYFSFISRISFIGVGNTSNPPHPRALEDLQALESAEVTTVDRLQVVRHSIRISKVLLKYIMLYFCCNYNISVISQSVLLVEETRVPGENHRTATSY
jgi:hypothetical protein